LFVAVVGALAAQLTVAEENLKQSDEEYLEGVVDELSYAHVAEELEFLVQDEEHQSHSQWNP
jgi:hypothetical protein